MLHVLVENLVPGAALPEQITELSPDWLRDICAMHDYEIEYLKNQQEDS
ncbi:hypothetical protein [Armatimonas sp.]